MEKRKAISHQRESKIEFFHVDAKGTRDIPPPKERGFDAKPKRYFAALEKKSVLHEPTDSKPQYCINCTYVM
jgi:hypothetical protein